LTDASAVANGGTTVRGHFVSEIAKVAGLDPEQTKTFMSRVAYAGHMAPLGKFGELLVYHGNETDPTNEWRTPQNPFSTTANGTRRIEASFGDRVVTDIYRAAENADPSIDNTANGTIRAVSHQTLLHDRLGAFKLLYQASQDRVTNSPAQTLAERLDDRAALRAWVKQTGFDKMLGMSTADTVHALDRIYTETIPTPIQERMTSRSHFVNIFRQMVNAKKTLAELKQAEPHFLQQLTMTLPNVRYLTVGHDHDERSRVGTVPGKGNVGMWDTNTWTKTKGEDQLGVVVAHTDGNGRIDGDPQAFRVNAANGKPEFPTRGFEEKDPVPGWRK
jgi:hypothetical protein